jgi:germination protein M
MKKKKVLVGLIALLAFTILATGCVFGPKDDVGSEPIDPPQFNYTEGEDSTEIVFEFSEADAPADGSVTEGTNEKDRTIYVFDHQGYVVPLTVKVPFSEGVAKQALEYMVIGGPVSSLLPDGVRAVLPADTEVDVTITDGGIAIVDFSPEFKDYQAEDEKGILEAITWTLTQFDSVKEVVIWINGYEQKVMPVNGTPIGKSLSRKDGINIEVADGTNIGNSSVITLYFQAQSPSATHEYYVPISRLVPRSNDLVLSTVNQLISGPKQGSGLYSTLAPSTQVLNANVTGNMAIIDFDEQLLSYSINQNKAPDEALTALVLSLTESGLVEQVQFMVNGDSKVESVKGRDLSTPVARPISINATGY